MVLSPSVYILLVARIPTTSDGRPVNPNFLLLPRDGKVKILLQNVKTEKAAILSEICCYKSVSKH